MLRKLKDLSFRLASQAGRCTLHDTIVVNGSPRSGTTWMLELLRSLPGYKALNEPLMYPRARREHGFSWRTHLTPDASDPEKEQYLHRVLEGQVDTIPAWHFATENRLRELWTHATRRKLVVKFCRLHRMLHWFAGRFEVRGIVFMIRHPCAVVASMLRHGGWEEERLRGQEARQHVQPEDGIPGSLRTTFDPILERIDTRTEALATLWCMDHYVPLVDQADGSYPWLIVPYERLVSRGQIELQRVVEGLGVEMTAKMNEQFREPSSSVRDQLHEDAEEQLSKWRRRLSKEQIDAVLGIVREAGLSNIYTDALEPNYDSLNPLQRPEHRW